MAMNGNNLGDEIIAAINSVTGGVARAREIQIWHAIGTAIVQHIQSNAVTHQPPDSDGDSEQDGTIT